MATIKSLTRDFFQAIRPPPKLSLSEWADTFAVLSAVSSAEAGRWKTLPYQKGIMDAITDPRIEAVWCMKSARVGWTKILNFAVGYHIHQDPCSMMIVQPTLEDAQGYSKEELTPMFDDTPVLKGIVSDGKVKGSESTILQKIYPGGTTTIVGSTSPRGFRRVSRRLVAFDEVDGYPASAGDEGDPVKLGIRRTEYFWNRKIIGGSTPTTKDFSRIEKLFLSGDQRRYFVPCPQCEAMQYLKWANLKWPEGKPREAYFVCEANGCVIEHKDKRKIIEQGEWRSTSVAENPKRISFHIWAAYSYSPNSSWGDLAAEFLDAKSDQELLKTFVNTVLGETWEEEYSAKLSAEGLSGRAELEFESNTAPEGVLLCTAGVDVQDNRLAIEITGWGEGEESWKISYQEIMGDPARPELWEQLKTLLGTPVVSVDGRKVPIVSSGIDSGGHFTHEVYEFARVNKHRGIFALRGASQRNKPAIGKPSRVDLSYKGLLKKKGAEVYVVGSDTIKSTLFGRLKLTEPGPQYTHFNRDLGPEYYEMLTSEKQTVRYLKGQAIREWTKKNGARNEALDVAVYSFAALQLYKTRFVRETFWLQMKARFLKLETVIAEEKQTGQSKPQQPRFKAPKKSWLNRY